MHAVADIEVAFGIFRRVRVIGELKRLSRNRSGAIVQHAGREGGRAFIACTPDNYVAVLDLNTFKITGHIDVGGDPDGLAWAVQR